MCVRPPPLLNKIGGSFLWKGSICDVLVQKAGPAPEPAQLAAAVTGVKQVPFGTAPGSTAWEWTVTVTNTGALSFHRH